jgi:hypothetical protein
LKEDWIVPRLSIVIVSNRSARELETTLVSVLENRPADCEILASLAHDYTDPYQLDGEVQFASAPATASGVAAASEILGECRGEVVHLLAAGTQVAEDWADAALDHFARDAHLGAVAPLVLDAAEHRTVVSAGIHYHRSGKQRVRRATMARSRICESHARPEVVLGPALSAGFYRREALLAACACCGFVGRQAIADADVALSLAELGYLAVLEPRSIVFAPTPAINPRETISAGRAAEAVFWRHAAAQGMATSLVAHAALVGGEICAAIARPALAKRLIGRLIGLCELPRHLGHAGRVAEQLRLADDESPASPSVSFEDRSRAIREGALSPAVARRAA